MNLAYVKPPVAVPCAPAKDCSVYSSGMARKKWALNLNSEQVERCITYLKHYYIPNSLATCPKQPKAVACRTNVEKDMDLMLDTELTCVRERLIKQKEDMETNMLTSYNNLSATAALPTEQVQMDFLRSEARNARNTVNSKLLKQFGLTGDDAPATVEELIKRIQDGKFVVDDENKKRHAYYAKDYISWRDPAIKKDQAGFDAANDLLSAKYRDTKRAIMTQGADAGLKAVLDLEAFTA